MADFERPNIPEPALFLANGPMLEFIREGVPPYFFLMEEDCDEPGRPAIPRGTGGSIAPTPPEVAGRRCIS